MTPEKIQARTHPKDNQFPVTVCSQARAQSLSEDPEKPETENAKQW